MPQRIQLSRAKGWRKPDGAIVVSRPSRWGNPFRHDGTKAGKAIAAAQFRAHLKRSRGFPPDWPDFRGYPSDAEIREHLAGRDLCCWCPVGGPCHGDVLLGIANEDYPPPGRPI